MRKNLTYFMKIMISLILIFINQIFGQDFQISEKEYAAFAPQISCDSAGNFVVVWTDYRNSYENGGIDSGSAIYGQLYSHSRIKLGDNFRISEEELGGGNRVPSVSMNSKGNFIVAWHTTGKEASRDTDIYARIFNKDGSSQTPSFKINDDTTNEAQLDAKVILQDNESFIITWADRRDKALFSYAQLFDSLGKPIGKNFKVNKNNIEDAANISQFADGKFIVHWGEYIDIYNMDGTPYNNGIINIGINGTIFAKGKDSILVLWSPPSEYEIHGCFFNIEGNQVSESFKINDDNLNNPIGRKDVAFSNEGFIIVWQDHRNDFPRTLGKGDIYAQRFNSVGEIIGENFKVNHEPKEITQRDPSVIFNNDKFIAIWTEIHSICLPAGTIAQSPSYIMGAIQEFNDPIPGEVFGWETIKDPCEEEQSNNNILDIYPNPFSAQTNINFTITEESFINISIYNILGQKIITLKNEFMTQGKFNLIFDSQYLSSGVYILQFYYSDIVSSAKLLVLH